MELWQIKNKDVNITTQHEAAHVSTSLKRKREMHSFNWVTATLQLNETQQKMNAQNNSPH